MIERLRGTLVEKNPTDAVVECGGVGYSVRISLHTFSALSDPGAEVRLFTYLQVREDAQVLFGFATREERDLFLLLLSVNKIGPKTAQSLLSGTSLADLAAAIRTGNVAALIKIPGVGRQSAERIILELKGKIDRVALTGAVSGSPLSPVLSQKPFQEAVLALESLGYKRVLAEKAVVRVAEGKGEKLPVAEIIKSALKYV